MPKLKIQIDITIKCEKCQRELSTDFNEDREILTVEPCEKCLQEQYDEGRADFEE